MGSSFEFDYKPGGFLVKMVKIYNPEFENGKEDMSPNFDTINTIFISKVQLFSLVPSYLFMDII